VAHRVHRVVALRTHEQVEPRERIEDLGPRVGEHGLAEAEVGIPHRPRASHEHVHEALALAPEERVDVSLEEDVPAEEEIEEDEAGEPCDDEERGLRGPAVSRGAGLVHRNLSLRAAKPLIWRSSRPARKREMFVSP